MKLENKVVRNWMNFFRCQILTQCSVYLSIIVHAEGSKPNNT